MSDSAGVRPPRASAPRGPARSDAMIAGRARRPPPRFLLGHGGARLPGERSFDAMGMVSSFVGSGTLSNWGLSMIEPKSETLEQPLARGDVHEQWDQIV